MFRPTQTSSPSSPPNKKETDESDGFFSPDLSGSEELGDDSSSDSGEEGEDGENGEDEAKQQKVVAKAVAKKAKAKAAKPRWLCVPSNPKHGPSIGSEELH